MTLDIADGCLVTDPAYELKSDALGRAAAALQRPAVSIVTGPVLIQSDDGEPVGVWRPTALTISAVFVDPRGVPPVWIARRAGTSRSREAIADPIELADAWIRQLQQSRDGGLAIVDAPIAAVRASMRTRWEELLGRSDYPEIFRRFLERHQDLLEPLIKDIMVGRELAFAELRNAHFDLVRRRAADAAELEAAAETLARNRALFAAGAVSSVDWGSFDRTYPICREWGYSRGGPVDRRYIRDFISAHSSDIRGRVLEVQEGDLSAAFGGTRAARCDVLDINPSNEHATVVADLRAASSIADGAYECIILTQTAHLIDDVPAVIRECRRILAPGGVLLATLPCLSRLCVEYGPDRDFWRVTPAGARVLASTAFDDVRVEAFGNVKTAVAFLHGLGEGELTEHDYASYDPQHPLLVGIRACKRARADAPVGARGVVLLYHRIENAPNDPFALNVAPDVFAAHLEWLRAHAAILPLEDLLARPADSLPDNAVAITFDDVSAAHLERVAAVLAGSGVPATFFLTTAGLDDASEYWWDRVERSRVPARELSALHDRLVHASLEERAAILAPLREESPATRRPLLRHEVRRLAAVPNVTIGAHSVHHLCLPDQPPDIRVREMRESRRALEEATGAAIGCFAYPYGAVDRATADLARREFRWTLDCDARLLGESFDAARVPRLEVKAWEIDELAAQIERRRGREPFSRTLRLLP
jgi:peptidoglycan/xylan/chitin deacetylase (PgdA/CDA1 family)